MFRAYSGGSPLTSPPTSLKRRIRRSFRRKGRRYPPRRITTNLPNQRRLSRSCPEVDSVVNRREKEFEEAGSWTSSSTNESDTESSEENSLPVSRMERQLARQSLRRSKRREDDHKKNMEENKISMDDYLGKQAQFQAWMLEEQKKDVRSLTSPKRKTYFKMFMRVWNKQHLPAKYYECRVSQHLDEETAHQVLAPTENMSVSPVPEISARPKFSLVQNSPALDPTLFPHTIDLSTDSIVLEKSSPFSPATNAAPSPFSTFGKTPVSALTFRFSANGESEGHGSRKKDVFQFGHAENKENIKYPSLPSKLRASVIQDFRTAKISPRKKMSVSQERSIDRTSVRWSPQGQPKLNPVGIPRCPSPFQRSVSQDSTASCSLKQQKQESATMGKAEGSGTAGEINPTSLLPRTSQNYCQVKDSLGALPFGFSPPYAEIPLMSKTRQVCGIKEQLIEGSLVDGGFVSRTMSMKSAKEKGMRRRSRSLDESPVYATPSRKSGMRREGKNHLQKEMSMSPTPPPVPPKMFDPHVEGLGIPYTAPHTRIVSASITDDEPRLGGNRAEQCFEDTDKKSGGKLLKGKLPWFGKKLTLRRRSRSMEVLSPRKPLPAPSHNGDDSPFPLVQLERSPTFGRKVLSRPQKLTADSSDKPSFDKTPNTHTPCKSYEESYANMTGGKRAMENIVEKYPPRTKENSGLDFSLSEYTSSPVRPGTVSSTSKIILSMQSSLSSADDSVYKSVGSFNSPKLTGDNLLSSRSTTVFSDKPLFSRAQNAVTCTSTFSLFTPSVTLAASPLQRIRSMRRRSRSLENLSHVSYHGDSIEHFRKFDSHRQEVLELCETTVSNQPLVLGCNMAVDHTEKMSTSIAEPSGPLRNLKGNENITSKAPFECDSGSGDYEKVKSAVKSELSSLVQKISLQTTSSCTDSTLDESTDMELDDQDEPSTKLDQTKVLQILRGKPAATGCGQGAGPPPRYEIAVSVASASAAVGSGLVISSLESVKSQPVHHDTVFSVSLPVPQTPEKLDKAATKIPAQYPHNLPPVAWKGMPLVTNKGSGGGAQQIQPSVSQKFQTTIPSSPPKTAAQTACVPRRVSGHVEVVKLPTVINEVASSASSPNPQRVITGVCQPLSSASWVSPFKSRHPHHRRSKSVDEHSLLVIQDAVKPPSAGKDSLLQEIMQVLEKKKLGDDISCLSQEINVVDQEMPAEIEPIAQSPIPASTPVPSVWKSPEALTTVCKENEPGALNQSPAVRETKRTISLQEGIKILLTSDRKPRPLPPLPQRKPVGQQAKCATENIASTPLPELPAAQVLTHKQQVNNCAGVVQPSSTTLQQLPSLEPNIELSKVEPKGPVKTVLQRFGDTLRFGRQNRRRSRSVGDLTAADDEQQIKAAGKAQSKFSNVLAFWDRQRSNKAGKEKAEQPDVGETLQRKPSTMKRLHQQLWGSKAETDITGQDAASQQMPLTARTHTLAINEPEVAKISVSDNSSVPSVQASQQLSYLQPTGSTSDGQDSSGRTTFETANARTSKDSSLQKSPFVTVRRQTSKKKVHDSFSVNTERGLNTSPPHAQHQQAVFSTSGNDQRIITGLGPSTPIKINLPSLPKPFPKPSYLQQSPGKLPLKGGQLATTFQPGTVADTPSSFSPAPGKARKRRSQEADLTFPHPEKFSLTEMAQSPRHFSHLEKFSLTEMTQSPQRFGHMSASCSEGVEPQYQERPVQQSFHNQLVEVNSHAEMNEIGPSGSVKRLSSENASNGDLSPVKRSNKDTFGQTVSTHLQAEQRPIAGKDRNSVRRKSSGKSKTATVVSQVYNSVGAEEATASRLDRKASCRAMKEEPLSLKRRSSNKVVRESSAKVNTPSHRSTTTEKGQSRVSNPRRRSSTKLTSFARPEHGQEMRPGASIVTTTAASAECPSITRVENSVRANTQSSLLRKESARNGGNSLLAKGPGHEPETRKPSVAMPVRRGVDSGVPDTGQPLSSTPCQPMPPDCSHKEKGDQNSGSEVRRNHSARDGCRSATSRGVTNIVQRFNSLREESSRPGNKRKSSTSSGLTPRSKPLGNTPGSTSRRRSSGVGLLTPLSKHTTAAGQMVRRESNGKTTRRSSRTPSDLADSGATALRSRRLKQSPSFRRIQRTLGVKEDGPARGEVETNIDSCSADSSLADIELEQRQHPLSTLV